MSFIIPMLMKKGNPYLKCFNYFWNLNNTYIEYDWVITSSWIIYSTPFSNSPIVVLDTNDDSISYISNPTSESWTWLVDGWNGFLYWMPRGAESILKINTSNNTATTIWSLPDSNFTYPRKKFVWWVRVWNFIYWIPNLAWTILKIDITNDNVTTFWTVSEYWWNGWVLSYNGYIYCMPLNSDNILKIDPSNDTYSTFWNWISSQHYWWIEVNWYIYSLPLIGTSILKINTSNDTFELIWWLPSWLWCDGIVLWNNGMLYWYGWKIDPWSSDEYTVLIKINPTNDTYKIYYWDSKWSISWTYLKWDYLYSVPFTWWPAVKVNINCLT